MVADYQQRPSCIRNEYALRVFGGRHRSPYITKHGSERESDETATFTQLSSDLNISSGPVVFVTSMPCVSLVVDTDPHALLNMALSENLTKRPLLRNFLHPLNCEEPTLVTAIRLAMDERHRSGWFEREHFPIRK